MTLAVKNLLEIIEPNIYYKYVETKIVWCVPLSTYLSGKTRGRKAETEDSVTSLKLLLLAINDLTCKVVSLILPVNSLYVTHGFVSIQFAVGGLNLSKNGYTCRNSLLIE